MMMTGMSRQATATQPAFILESLSHRRRSFNSRPLLDGHQFREHAAYDRLAAACSCIRPGPFVLYTFPCSRYSSYTPCSRCDQRRADDAGSTSIQLEACLLTVARYLACS